MGKLAVAAAATAVVGLATASPALADTTVTVNPGNVPTTAAAYGTHDCDDNFGGGPHSGSDVWVFVLPGNHDKTGDFVSVTATFGANGTLTIPADGGAVVTDKGASKAWITTPAGWTLTGASAVITGTAAKFNLTHTCPAGGGGQTSSPSPSPSVSKSSGSNGGSNGGANGGSTGGGSGVAGGSSGGGSGGLPVTGTAVTSVALTGAALVAAGIVLLVARRRREALVFSAGDDAQGKQ
jgi:LPXTG-motif cell wall-anchored protein